MILEVEYSYEVIIKKTQDFFPSNLYILDMLFFNEHEPLFFSSGYNSSNFRNIFRTRLG
jgi:hypothetical protein